ncbi:hypothetical protein RO3G_14445 [Lichtheimia corymbifera JMRC:FSU:9682]|uniref:Uncharacterized protein n=1 Tax=Lichtheimia corymbifera JMRC:FSU:9682 TaxID=1263082 RepID=A0A068RIJ1_9FUNG|nr:hypothetical protein RO3G_14445 [Lichtheimia corymbifera JMRC:FSU:9682]
MNQQRKRARQRYSALVSQPTVIPDVYGNKKRATEAVRRQLEKDNDSEFDSFDLEDWPIMSDTAAAAQLLIEQAIAPKHKGSESARRIPRICLVHQIYAILSDNTTVDREVQQLAIEGSWRKFHVTGTMDDELVLMRTEDYLATIDEAKQECMVDKEHEKGLCPETFDRFKDLIKDAKYPEVTIKRSSLEEFTDNEISQLIRYHIILPHTTIANTYWFAVRRNGMFMSYLRKGRSEILRALKKRMTKDMLEKQIKERKLNSTVLSHSFILRDLVGSGRVERHKTPMGDLIRLTKKGERSL